MVSSRADHVHALRLTALCYCEGSWEITAPVAGPLRVPHLHCVGQLLPVFIKTLHYGDKLSTWSFCTQTGVNGCVPMLQAALTACHEFCGDLEEVHFVLFGSDTYDVWRAQADEHLQPILGSAGSEETQASEPKPVQDGSSPMQGTMPPVDDGASPMQVRLSPDTSPTNPLKQGHDNVQLKDESPLGSLQNDTSIQTLTGVKVGEAGESAQEAMAAPEVLEAAAPAQQSGLSRRGPSTDSSEAAEDKQFSHTKGQSNADCSAAKDTGTSSM